MNSVGDVRAVLAAVAERTDHARGQVQLAHVRLDEVSRIFADLDGSTNGTLPHADVDRARGDLDELLRVIAAASGVVDDLGRRL